MMFRHLTGLKIKISYFRDNLFIVLCSNLDFFNLLSYDYHSAYEPVVNHHAPLFGGGDPDNEYNFEAQLSIVNNYFIASSGT
jgi:GH18 family chitinase